MEIITRLRGAIGDAFVLTAPADTAKWARDWAGEYTSDPIAVLRPADTAQVAAVMAIAHETGTPVVPVGGNTGLNGGAVANGAVQVSLDRLNQITSIDPAGRTATVGAGVILSNLHDAVADHDLIFPLTFGARGSAMIGGVLSTNAGGSNVLRYGNTRDLVLGIEVVMADGRIMNLMGALHKDNSGLNLKHLMIGAEGTLGVITAAVVKLSPKPHAYATAMVAAVDLPAALEMLHRIQSATGNGVEALEYMPRSFIDGHLALHPEAREPFDAPYDVNILIEVGAMSPVTDLLEDALGQMLEDGLIYDAVIAQNEAQRREMWARREAAAEIGYAKTPFVDADIAVPLAAVQTWEAAMQARLAAIDPTATDTIVAHLGDGNIHYSAFPSRDDPVLKDQIKQAVEEEVQKLRGSFSAEHGVGISKLSTMKRRKDPVALAAMRAIKQALDPKGILNPGKMYPD